VGKWAQEVEGAVEIAAGVVLAATGVGAAFAPYLITAGVGTMLSGIGTLLQKGPLPGVTGAGRNPIAPWNVVYGRARVGGTIVYMNSFGENDKYLDLVIVLACHPCQNIDQLLVDGNYVPINPTTRCSYTRTSRTYYHGDSNGTGNTTFQRQAGIVTVTLSQSVTGLLGADSGDKVQISSMPSGSPTAQTLQGIFTITISPTNPDVFTYISPGPDTGPVVNAGHITTIFADYKSKIYMENLLGTQTLGQTFNGMTNGTPYDGDTSNLVQVVDNNGNPIPNPWTAQHSLVGMTATFLRLHYNDQIFANGIPQFSFVVRGKNDIYDPRLGTYGSGGTTGYTENAALCTADFLAHKKWGYKLNYGTDIPTSQLVAAANTCDQSVNLAAGGTEPNYSCNGQFTLSMKRGEILQNMLTSCAGRITNGGGQWIIWPGAWQGVSGSPINFMSVAAGKPQWKPKVGSYDLYNAVKGTYMSPINNWQTSDFPAYLQNSERGFSSDNFLAQDGGDRRYLDVQLPFTISASMAQRIAKIELMRRRYQGVAVLPMNMSGYQMTALDVWEFNLPLLGWTNKQFEILSHRLKFDKQSDGARDIVLLGTEVDVQETDVSIYDWSTTEELTPQGYQQPVLPSTLNPNGPTNVMLESDTSTAVVQSNGIIQPRISVTWTDPQDGFFVNGGHIETQFQLVATPTPPWQSVQSVLPGVQQLYITGVTMGASYNVQVRAVNAAGVPSNWVSAGPVIVSAQSASPYGPNGGTIAPLAGDPIYSQAMFGLSLSGVTKSDGSVLVNANVTPAAPASVFSTVAPTPVLAAGTPATGGGGNIPGGQTLVIAIAAVDSTGAYTPLSNQVNVVIPSGSNYDIPLTISNYAASMVNFLIFVGLNPGVLSYRYTDTAAASYTLLSIAYVTGDSYGVPDARFDHFVIGTTKIALAGVYGGAVGSLMTLAGVPTISGGSYNAPISGATLTPASLVGRVLSTIRFAGSSADPLQDFPITGNSSNTILFTRPAPGTHWRRQAAPSFTVGDMLVVRIQPTLSSGGTVVTDSLLNMTANQYAGYVLRVFFADGSNQTSFIVSNTATAFTVQAGNPFTGANPLWCWVEAGSFSAMTPATPAQMSSFESSGLPLTAPIDNVAGFVGVQVFASDEWGNLSDAGYSPIRDCYWPGQTGTVTVVSSGGYYTILPDSSGNFTIDIANGSNQRIQLTSATASGTPPTTLSTIKPPIWTGGSIVSGVGLTLYVDQDGTGGWPMPDFNFFVTNPGFESGALTPGWSDSISSSSTIVSTQSHSGVYSASCSVQNNAIYQQVTGLTPGVTYTVFAWLLCTGSASGYLMIHDTTGANQVTGSPFSPNVWTLISLAYTANSTGAMRIHLFKDNSNSDTLYWDDVCVTVPGGFTSEFSLQSIDGTPHTRSVFNCKFHGIYFGLDFFKTGTAVF
jgi:hypothetical protein